MKIIEIEEPKTKPPQLYECEICRSTISDPVFIVKTTEKHRVEAYVCRHHIRSSTTPIGEYLDLSSWEVQSPSVLKVKDMVEKQALELSEKND